MQGRWRRAIGIAQPHPLKMERKVSGDVKDAKRLSPTMVLVWTYWLLSKVTFPRLLPLRTWLPLPKEPSPA